MNTIQVPQAIFASADSGPVKGYHLVAQTQGIAKQWRDCLSRWSPSRLPIDDNLTCGIFSSFLLDDGNFAIGRTFMGGPEYSERGGHQLITRYLIVSKKQFEPFGFDPINFGLNAYAFGALRLPHETTCGQLTTQPIPREPIVDSSSQAFVKAASLTDDPGWKSLLDKAAATINCGKRIAIIGIPNPTSVASLLIARLSSAVRLTLSLTTGLQPSVRRPFQLHFLPSIDDTARSSIKSQGIVCLYHSDDGH